MKIRLYTILLSFLLPLVCHAQQPEDNLPECIQLARMNVITVGGGVPAAAPPACGDNELLGEVPPIDTTSYANAVNWKCAEYAANGTHDVCRVHLKLYADLAESQDLDIGVAIYATNGGSPPEPTGSPLASGFEANKAIYLAETTYSVDLSSSVTLTNGVFYWACFCVEDVAADPQWEYTANIGTKNYAVSSNTDETSPPTTDTWSGVAGRELGVSASY